MLSTLPGDHPLGLQILGVEPVFILRAMEVLQKYKFDLLDFNAACPAKKVVRRGEGAGLLKEPEKLRKLLKLVVANSQVPVSVKIRIGWDKDSVNAREIALLAEDAGAKALIIHGRTKMQGYGGTVDYRIIAEVKKALKIPLIASGDILSAELAKKMFDETGCDAIAFARGALGNPWIFRQTEELLKKGRVSSLPEAEEIKRVMAEHLKACADFYGQKNGVIIFRKFFSWYTRGFRNIRPLREKASRVKTQEEMLGLLKW
jgi:tRNA-dihydrouridine synthase B